MRVKVWNDNKYVYREKFKGDMIVIEPGQYVSMDIDDANQFMGQFVPIKVKGDNVPDVTGLKKLRLDRSVDVPRVQESPVDSGLVCNKCKYVAVSQTDLSEHALLAHERDLMSVDDVKKVASKR